MTNTRTKAKDYEFDLHVWVKPETKNMTRTYTVSGRGSCIDMPIDEALDFIRRILEDDGF